MMSCCFSLCWDCVPRPHSPRTTSRPLLLQAEAPVQDVRSQGRAVLRQPRLRHRIRQHEAAGGAEEKGILSLVCPGGVGLFLFYSEKGQSKEIQIL